MEQLLEYLATTPKGTVAVTDELAPLLAACWDGLAGSRATGVAAADLPERIHNVYWHPPLLSFKLVPNTPPDRDAPHAPLPRWEADLNRRTVTRARPPTPPPSSAPPKSKFNMPTLADTITRLVIEHRPDSRLRWYDDGCVRVAVGTIFPEGGGFKQTVSNRRRKFRLALEEKLTAAGWRKVKDYIFAPPAA